MNDIKSSKYQFVSINTGELYMLKDDIPRYSIIIPAYNVEKYVVTCLDSIYLQNFNNYECIVIDDGSTDNTGSIIEDYCVNHDKFYYYKKTNTGLSDTRNYGLTIAKGEYIIFIDSDDVISKYFFSIIENTINDFSNMDMVYIGYKKFNDGEIIIDNDKQEYDKHLLSPKKMIKYPSFSWLRIAKKELYDNNLFPKGCIYEDVVVSSILAFKAEKIVQIQNTLYFYRKREMSITTSSAVKQFELFDAMNVLAARCEKLNIPKVYYHTAFVNMAQSVFISLVRINNNRDFFVCLKKSWNEYKKINLLDGLCSYSYFKYKVLFIILKIKWFGLPFYFLLKLLLRLFTKKI